MTLKAGFAEIDITPPIGTHIIGWIKDIISDQVVDPLHAHAAVFSSGGFQVGFIQLDTATVRWTTTDEIRRRIRAAYDFPAENLMVCATHTHAGPAVAACGVVKRDDAYVAAMVDNAIKAFGEALSRMEEAEVGFNHVYEWNVAHNRRVVMRDGTARTHGTFSDPDALYVEGPIDPEVAVIAARSKATHKLLGTLVNFACHPTHHGGEGVISAGFPGVAARELKKWGCPVTVYLNGPSGNVHHAIPETSGDVGMEEAGKAIAEDAMRAMERMIFSGGVELAARSVTIQLPYRDPSGEETRGAVRGAQRFIDPKLYDMMMPRILKRISERKVQPAEVQTIRIGDAYLVSIPAEYFVQFGLRIKMESHPRHAVVVEHANGCVGYIPTREAFQRGGYETTLSPGSRMAPEAGDILADAAIRLIREI